MRAPSRRTFELSLLAILVAFAFACADGSGSPLAIDLRNPVTGVLTVDPTNLRLVVGDSAKLVAVGPDGRLVGVNDVKWSVDNSKILSVTLDGSAVAMAPGSAEVSVHSNGKKGSARALVMSASTQLVLVSGEGQSARAGELLSQPLVARVVDGSGIGIAGVRVDWTVASGGGSVTNRSVWTAADGVASTEWRLGSQAEPQVVRAEAARIGSLSYSATVSGGAIASASIAPAASTIVLGSQVQLTATARDAQGALLSGITWYWQSGNPAAAAVSSTGLVTGTGVGTSTITASSVGKVVSATVTVVQSATPGLRLLSGSNQTGEVAKPLAQPLVVELRDASGVPISGATISWSPAGNGSVSPASSATDAQGRAQTVWTLGTVAGAQQATATAGGVGAVAFTATAKPGPATRVDVTPAAPSIQVGQTLPFNASGTDAYGNAVSAAWVWTTSNSGVATISSAGAAQGKAAGTATIRAYGGGGEGSATLTVGGAVAGSSVAKVVASPDALSFEALATTLKLSATATDNVGNILSGVTFSWLSTNPSVATVDAMGNVVSKAAGIAAIVVGVGCCADTVPVVVAQTPTKLEIAPISLSLQVGETRQLSAAVKDGHGYQLSNPVVTWSTSKPSVAQVSSTGVVTGLASGDVVIQATFQGVSGTATAVVGSTSVLPPPPPPPSTGTGWRANEPQGLTAVTDRSWDAVNEQGWGTWVNTAQKGELAVIADPTAPRSSPNVGRVRFAAGQPGSDASLDPVSHEFGRFSGRDVYMTFSFKVSENWQGHKSGGNKVFYLTGSGSGNWGDPIFMALAGIGSDRLTFRVAHQNPDVTPGSVWYKWDDPANQVKPAMTDAEIVRGRWHQIEVFVHANTPGQADGEIHAWVDGKKILQFRSATFMSADDPTGKFDNLRWEPIWGGSGDLVRADMYQYIDHLYMSVR